MEMRYETCTELWTVAWIWSRVKMQLKVLCRPWVVHQLEKTEDRRQMGVSTHHDGHEVIHKN